VSLFSKILAILAISEQAVLPIVIHSPEGILLMNAGEELTLELAQLFGTPQAAAPVAAAPAAAQPVTAVAVAVAEPQAVPQGAIHAVNLSALKPS
jgi:hypothetical protein